MAAALQPKPILAYVPVAGSSRGTLGFTLLLAAALHLLLVLTVGLEVPKPKTEPHRVRPLEVVVLRRAAPTDEVPDKADAYAQVDRVGNGTDSERTATDHRPIEQAPDPDPLPTPVPPEPVAQPLPPEPVAEAAPEPELTATLDSAEATDPPAQPELPPEPDTPPEPLPVPQPPVTAAQILASSSLEIAKLRAKIEEDTSSFASRLRRKAISASTREYKYASYLEAWRRKVERVGNLNYPREAKQHKLYGNLILHVSLRADGSIEDLRILRSSGFDVLDKAATRIVELAAPFSPFPPDIRAETDILDITRTWQFLSTNRLGWNN